MKMRTIIWIIAVAIALFNTVSSYYRMYSQASSRLKWHVVLWTCIVLLGLIDYFLRLKTTRNRRRTKDDGDEKELKVES